jgi:Ca2+-binding RTX toxin-like protein
MPRASRQLVRRYFVATALASIAFVALPAVSPAATVRVEEVSGYANLAHLTFVAAAGESNSVTVAIAGEEGDYFKLQVIDSGAAVEPGPMCSGGGAPGTPVDCRLHKGKGPEQMLLGGKVLVPAYGTRWEDDFNVDLGDGDNSFDASGMPSDPFEAIKMTVRSGSGNDTIATASGGDAIDPGAGADTIHAGGEYDRVYATETPDGPDVYDLGAEVGKVDYSRRQEPVVLNGQRVGAPGENDLLIAGSPYVTGGSGDDALVGSGGSDILEGNGGNDSIVGGGGHDELAGGLGEDLLEGEDGKDVLVGNPGDDLLVGGAGDDRLYETQARVEPDYSTLLPTPSGPSGTDTGLGGTGDDVIVLGDEADRALGGGGEDHLYGQDGSDLLKGGGGHDQEVGGTGHDRLWGGRGPDTLFGGRTPDEFWFFVKAPDDGRDLLGCGPGRDVASANPWDDARSCEVIHRVRPHSRG